MDVGIAAAEGGRGPTALGQVEFGPGGGAGAHLK
jgi:hypothetical protein